MSSVGILTFINTLNYGAEFQAYALLTVVLNQKLDCEIIYYECPAVAKRERATLPSLSDLRTPKHYVGMLLKYPEMQKRRLGFEKFQRRFLCFGKPLYSSHEILSSYEKIIVGSDQVWSSYVTGGDRTYFLPDSSNFDNTVISYSASFGDSSVSSQYLNEIAGDLKNFDHISVREAGSIKLLEAIGVTDAIVTIDPTLLLSRQEWLRVSDITTKLPDRFIFLYLVSERDKCIEFARKVSSQLDAKILYIDVSGCKPVSGAINVGDASPSKFLTLISQAEMVITSSFHGLCFSIIFQKNFRYSIDCDPLQSRLASLASVLGLSAFSIENDDIKNIPNYKAVDSKLEKLKRKALNYLRSSLL